MMKLHLQVSQYQYDHFLDDTSSNRSKHAFSIFFITSIYPGVDDLGIHCNIWHNHLFQLSPHAYVSPDIIKYVM